MLIKYKENCQTNYNNCSVLKASDYSIKPVYPNCSGCNSKEDINELKDNILDIKYLPSNTTLPVISAYKAKRNKTRILAPNISFTVYSLQLPSGHIAELKEIHLSIIEQQPSIRIEMIDSYYKSIKQVNPKTSFNSVKQYCITENNNKDKTINNINDFKKAFNISDNSISYQESKCLLNIEKRTYVPAINIAFKQFDDFLLFEHYSHDYGIHGFRRY